MNNYILIAVSVIVIMLLIGYSCRTCGTSEYFHDYEARFSKEGQVQGFVGSSPNFRITELSNPSDNKFVLEQFNFDTKGFRTSVSLEPNSNYTITYWRANDDLYNALMAGLTEKQQLEIVRGIQSYLNHSDKQEMSLKLNILKTLTPREDETPKTYVSRMDKFFSDPKSLNGGSKKKKRKTQKKRKRNKRRKSNKKRRSRKSKKKKSRSRRRR